MTLKKMFLLALALVILIPATSNATVGRYMALGGDGTQFIVYDASNPGIYPSLVTKWKKLLGSEFSGAGAWNQFLVYTVWDFGDNKSAIKFVLDSSPSSMFDISDLGVFADEVPGVPDPSDAVLNGNFHHLNIIYGRPFGGIDAGLGLRYEGKSYDDNFNPDAKVEANYSSIGFTLGITALEKKLDAALSYDMGAFSRKEGSTTVVENDGSSAFGLSARYWHKYSETCTAVPHFRFTNHKVGWKQGDVTNADTHTDIVLGLGHNWRPVDNTLVIFEFGINSHTGKVETGNDDSETQTDMNVYWRAGGETKITDWLWGRVGAARRWVGSKYEIKYTGGSSEANAGYAETAVYVGASTHWNRLHMDFVIEPDFLKYGPNFIGGDSGQGIASYLSLKLELDEANWMK